VSVKERPYIKKLIKDLQVGDIILHPIYRIDGLLLIDRNRTLNEGLIRIMQKQLLPYATVLVAASQEAFDAFTNNDGTNTPEFVNEIKALTKEYQSNNTQNSEEPSANKEQEDRDSIFVKQLLSCPYWILLERKLDSYEAKKRCRAVKEGLINLLNDHRVFDRYYEIIKAYDDVLLIHSFNNLCTSLMIGLTLEMQIEELYDLAIGALFLNIGFTSLPKEDFKHFLRTEIYNTTIMKKTVEIFTQVTEEAYFLRKKSILQGILDVYENYNGSGNPNQKRNDEISLFGRIFHIVNSYDSMVGGYNYTVGLLPIEAFHIILENKYMRYDPFILQVLIHRTRYFKLDEAITLPNAIKAKIVGFDNYAKHPDRPIIELQDGTRINLMTMKL
jgi:HD-GYP domain-containing protein (c-di-GMP phosphodiesterase class II)